jgi:hypothetical protein
MAAHRPGVALAALASAAALTGCGGQSGAAPAATTIAPGAPAVLPTPTAATAIVKSLWTQRESALSSLDPSRLPAFETGAAEAADTAYINGVQCGCQPQRSVHTVIGVVPMIPRPSAGGAFLAQVRTTNAVSGEHPWYVLAVTRSGEGFWKIAYLTFGGYKTAAPLEKLTPAHGYTAPLTAAGLRRMARLALLSVRYSRTHNPATSRTAYGATVRSRALVRPRADGIFGLTLPSGRVLSCFTIHQLDTYSMPGGLAQNVARQQWGGLLAPGAYSSVRVDTAMPECTVGTGVGTKVGALWLRYDPQVVSTVGTPLTG